MANLNEQWQGDWMHDAETGQIVDGPVMNRYEMFFLIRELRAAVHAHAQTIRDKQAVIDDMQKRLAASEWQRDEWIAQANQLTVANDEKAGEIQHLRRALLDFSRQNCEVGLQAMREKHLALLVSALSPLHAQTAPKRKRLNNGRCAAQVVDCDCRFCIPDEELNP